MKNNIFEYGGKHFIPERKFNSADGGFNTITRCLKHNNELGFQEVNYYGNQKFCYNYDDFYKASTKKDYDVFRCLETDKLYIPCMHELQEFDKDLPRKRSKNYER